MVLGVLGSQAEGPWKVAGPERRGQKGQRLRRCQVLAHGLHGMVGVAAGQRLDDLGMLVVRMLGGHVGLVHQRDQGRSVRSVRPAAGPAPRCP